MDLQKNLFNDNGYLLEKKLFDRSLMDQLRLELDLITQYEKDMKQDCSYVNLPSTKGNNLIASSNLQRVWNLANKSESFHSILDNNRLLEIINTIFARDYSGLLYHLSSFQANILYPGALPQKIHIDCPFPEPIPPWLSKANCIIMIDDFTLTNGATEIVPSSHAYCRKPKPNTDDERDLVKIIGESGDVLFTHGNLWHRSGANEDSQPRRALLVSFCASFIRDSAFEEAHHLIRNQKIHLSENIKSMMGFNDGLKQGSQCFF